MIKCIKKIFNDTMTGIDGKSYHIAKFSWVFSSLAIDIIAIHQAFHGQIVDFMGFAGAQATVATAHGAVIWGTKSTEPSLESKSDV